MAACCCSAGAAVARRPVPAVDDVLRRQGAAGTLLAGGGLALLSRVGLHSTYAGTVLPSLLMIGVGLHGQPSARLTELAALHGDSTAFWWSAGIFAVGAVLGGTCMQWGPLTPRSGVQPAPSAPSSQDAHA